MLCNYVESFITVYRTIEKSILSNYLYKLKRHITPELYFMSDALWVITHLLTRNARD